MYVTLTYFSRRIVVNVERERETQKIPVEKSPAKVFLVCKLYNLTMSLSFTFMFKILDQVNK